MAFLSASELAVHFGVGRASRISRAEVRWPDGNVETFEDLPVNVRSTLVKGRGLGLVGK